MGHGLIATALEKKDLPPGVYFFNSVASMPAFKENLDWCMRESINEFIEVISYCKRTRTYLVFPSSAAVNTKSSAYARCKAAIEEIYHAYNYPALIPRIATGYGNEAHKGKNASAIYQWCEQMKVGESPVVYGDGNQTRDFIHADDIADTIELWAKEGKTGIHDIGTGVSTSFNEVIQTINKVLGTSLEPTYIPKAPFTHYITNEGVPTKVSLEDGIRKILNI